MQPIKILAITITMLCIVTIAFANWGNSRFSSKKFGADKWGFSQSADIGENYITYNGQNLTYNGQNIAYVGG